MLLKDLMVEMRRQLAPRLGDREASATVRFIFRELKGWDEVQLAFRRDDEVSDFVVDKANDAVRRVLADEPVQYIFGVAPFYGMDFKVTRDTLIPRQETSILVDMIVKQYAGRTDLRVLDLGTGSGCIAVALARNLKFADVTAVDISERALEVARENAAALRTKVRFLQRDMLEARFPADSFDIIVSNPPYIARSEASEMEANVLDYEPHGALFVSDDDPLVYYRAIARIAAESLVEGGRLYLEINPLFADDLHRLLTAAGLTSVEILPDYSSRSRFALATR